MKMKLVFIFKMLSSYEVVMKVSLLFLLLVALVVVSPLLAATPEGASGSPSPDALLILDGRVADATGAVIPKAKVQLLTASGKLVAETTSDDTGDFHLKGLRPGTYDLRVEYSGFASHTERIRVAEGQGLKATVTMSMAANNEVVSVTAEAAYSESTAVSGAKMEIPLRDLPQSIGVVNAELLRSQGSNSMQDAVRNVPAVSVHLGEGRRDQVLIRGFSAVNDQFVDGVRDDSPYYRDLSNVERIEVVKGPASVLYGRGSSGGIVNRITKSPISEGVLGEWSLIAGSYGEKRTNIDFGTPLVKDKLSFRATTAYENAGSFREQFGLNRFAIAPSLLFTPTKNTEFIFQSDNLKDNRLPDRGIPSLNGVPADVNIGQYYGDPSQDHMKNIVHGNTLRFQQHVNTWTIRNNTRYTVYDNSFFNTQPTGTSVVAGTVLVSREQYNVEATQHNFFNQTEATRHGHLLVDHLFLVGVEYGSQSRDSVRFTGTAAKVTLIDPTLTPVIPGTTPATNTVFDGTVAAIYVQDQLSFGHKVKAMVGGRFDYFQQKLNDRNPTNLDLNRIDRQFSPRAGFVYQPSHWVSLYSSYSRSFQPSGEGLSLAANAADLKPEVTTNYEVGGKFDLLGGRATSTVSVFRLDRNNVKTTDPSNTTRLLSVGLQRTNGFEVSMSGRVYKRFEVFGGYAYLDAKTVKSNTLSSGVPVQGKQAALVAPHSFNLWSTYSFENGFGVGGGVIFNDSRFAEVNNLVALPAFTRVDATVFYRKRHYEVAANLRNLANAKYYETANSNFQIMPGSPINGTITTRLRW
jgi:catecholate siderophore receptor